MRNANDRNARLKMRYWLLPVILTAAVCGALGAGSNAAEDVPPPPAPAPPTPLPFIPQRGQRPDDGSFQPRRDEPGLPSFVETLKSSDAAIQVPLGQGRLLTTKHPISSDKGTRFIAIGDPTILDFEVLPNPRMIRLTGKRAGVTDLSITTADDQTYSFEVHVTYDLDMIRAQIRHAFPDTEVKLGQLHDYVVVEGEVRNSEQVAKIMELVRSCLEPRQETLDTSSQTTVGSQQSTLTPSSNTTRPMQSGSSGSVDATRQRPARVINLLHVPGLNQVMLQVQIAELNRTALREIGADLLGVDPHTGTVVGTQLAGGTIAALGSIGLGGLTGTGSAAAGPNTTAFGIFPKSDFAIILRALRKNSLLSIMAEPNLVALSGHRASFLAGGQFPIPVPQGGGALTNNVTIQFKDFGVQLDFVPYILDDDTIRLSVTPEVSSIDFSLGTTLVVGGSPVPGLNTRRTSTTVELQQGQTLAIAGLLDVEMQATTNRIPGLGDLPYIGPLFSNTSHQRVEKELLILVSPYIVKPMRPDQVACLPGANVASPTDCEFYLKNQIEGRQNPVQLQHMERAYVRGPVGFSN
jgi:pilus assembly protein CpaC